ncbi:MAG TPA: type II toxin-antitoxin system HipA family toxin [Acidimicrobiales bacterium]|jgi:serine/threonine-protein kinase HipA|nr:type II toxin-antitoxin system HipA family toxin [Acidimicrobiales bacterium]
MAYVPVEVIEVSAWGRRVGAVALDPSSGFYVFEYSPDRVSSPVELAPTTMPFRVQPYVFTTLPVETFHRLPAMVADALPDEFGNALVDRELASRGVRKNDITPLDRLAYLGNRGIGALEFRPTRGPRPTKSTAITLADLVVAARTAVAGSFDGERDITKALRELIAVGTSAGGARPKAVVAINTTTGEIRSGQVPADPGFEHWIVKLDGVGDDLDLGASGGYGRIEYAYQLMAKAAGIEMMECRLLEEGGRAHFMTRRYDRPPWGGKVHCQTLCALGHLDFRQIGAHDYGQLFDIIDRLGLASSARGEAFRRMVFNVAAANCDDHTKNHSFVLPEDDAWTLSPAYDVTHAHSPRSVWTRQHLMSVNGRSMDITRADVDEVADRFQVPGAAAIVRDVLDAVDSWSEFAVEAGVQKVTVDLIGDHITSWSKPLD